ncbi:polysaccharide deacetylase family protein [Hyphobacterium sp. CCMP332]|nr:polysaccharide deacetylase family protein [Hyphobacterium sp. CCMP332]
MAGYRKQVLNRLRYATKLIPTNLLTGLVKPPCILPYYHCISDEPKSHLKFLYRHKSVREFRYDLDYLLKFYYPLNPGELLNGLELNRKGKIPFVLSFDDGLSEFYHVIAPILEEKGLSAICFLNSAFVDNKALFYRYKASLIVNQIIKDPQRLKLLGFANQNLEFVIQDILTIKYLESKRLDDIAEKIDLNFNIFLKKEKPYLDSTQIKSLIDRGFYFGAHSHDHPLYSDLNSDEQLSQTQKSLQYLESNFNLNYKLFSFPFSDFGVNYDFFKKINLKYPSIKTFGGAGLKTENIDSHFQRISFETSDLRGDEILKGEMLYYLLKWPFGKNKIWRK